MKIPFLSQILAIRERRFSASRSLKTPSRFCFIRSLTMFASAGIVIPPCERLFVIQIRQLLRKLPPATSRNHFLEKLGDRSLFPRYCSLLRPFSPAHAILVVVRSTPL